MHSCMKFIFPVSMKVQLSMRLGQDIAASTELLKFIFIAHVSLFLQFGIYGIACHSSQRNILLTNLHLLIN